MTMMMCVILLCTCSLSSAVLEAANSSAKLLVRKRRISEGCDARIVEFPYIVRIIILNVGSPDKLCGGTIIAPNAIITAAHCLERADVRTLRVRVGSSCWDGKPYLVQSYILHPDYDEDDMPPHDDLAIIKLAVPIELDGLTKNAVGINEYGNYFIDGTFATVAGWGLLSRSGNLPDRLQSLNMKIVAKAKCVRAHSEGSTQELYNLWRAIVYRSLRENILGLICAASQVNNKRQSVCKGDSGGPLVVGNKLVGVVSYAMQDCTSKPLPNVFTDVAYYRKWIDEKVFELTASKQ